eukprot:tig00020944_g16364.t1
MCNDLNVIPELLQQRDLSLIVQKTGVSLNKDFEEVVLRTPRTRQARYETLVTREESAARLRDAAARKAPRPAPPRPLRARPEPAPPRPRPDPGLPPSS